MKRLFALGFMLLSLLARGANPTIVQFDETNVAYVLTTGNDGTGRAGNRLYPFASIHAANNAVNANYGGSHTNWTISVGAGTFNEGTNVIQLTNNTTIKGAGKYQTVIQSQLGATTNACIAMNTGCVVQNCFIQANGFYTALQQLPIGAWDGASVGYGYSGIATVQDCAIFGDSDGPSLTCAATNPTNILQILRCDLLFDFDAAIVAGANSTLIVDGCYVNCVGTNAQSTGELRGICNNGSGGTLIVKNSLIRNRFTTNATATVLTGINVTATGCTNIIDNNIFDVFWNGPASANFCDISIHSGATTIARLSNNKRWDGTALQIVRTTGASPLISYIAGVDPSQIIEMTNGGALTLPTRTVNLGGSLIFTSDTTQAAAGSYGEIISSLVTSNSAVSVSANVVTNVTSIILSAGDWDVEGNVNFWCSSTSSSGFAACLSTNSGTLTNDGSEVFSGVVLTATSFNNSVTLPRKQYLVSGNTTVYLEGLCKASVGSITAYGGITARRIR